MNAYLQSSLLCALLIVSPAAVFAQSYSDQDDIYSLDANEYAPIAPSEDYSNAASFRSSGIAIADNSEPSIGGLGIWPAEGVNLPYDLWNNISEEYAIKLIKGLPQQIFSNSIRNLVIRLLTSETARSDLSEAFLTARVNALLRMGQASLAYKLLLRAPENRLLEKNAKTLHLLNAISGSEKAMFCETAQNYQDDTPDAFWQRFTVICFALKGDNAKAQLGLELLNEQNNAPPLFSDTLKALIQKKPVSVSKLSSLSREELAWLAAASKIPNKSVDKSDTILSFEKQSLLMLATKEHRNLFKDNAARFAFNQTQLQPLSDVTPDIPLKSVNIDSNADSSAVRKALLTLAMRRVWGKPVSLEIEQSLWRKKHTATMTELSSLWREISVNQQDDNQRAASLLTLITPLTDPLRNYTINDVEFIVMELKSLGLLDDAVAVTEEVLAE